MTHEPVRLILAGTGGMGRAWLREIARTDAVQLVGVVDLDQAAAGSALAETGSADVPAATSVESLLTGGVTADAVINATIPAAHLPVSEQAMRLGLPVLCEKPLAETLAECLRSAAVSEVTGRLLMVSQSRRYWQSVYALRRVFDGGAPVEIATCRFARNPQFTGFRATMDDPLLVDMSIHHFDLARVLLAAEPVSVLAESWNPSYSSMAGDGCASVTVTFDSGARLCYAGSWCSPGVDTSWNGEWVLSGSTGTAGWDGDGAPRWYPADGDHLELPLAGEPEEIAGSLAEFVTAITTGATPTWGEVHHNVVSVATVLAAVRSARTHEPVSIAELIAQARTEAVEAETDPAVRAALAG